MKKKWKKITILSILTVFLLSPFQVNAAGERTLGDYRRTYENYLKEKQENDNKNEQAKKKIIGRIQKRLVVFTTNAKSKCLHTIYNRSK